MFKIHTQDMTDNSVDYTLVNMCQNMIKHFCDNTELTKILDCLKVSNIFLSTLKKNYCNIDVHSYYRTLRYIKSGKNCE